MSNNNMIISEDDQLTKEFNHLRLNLREQINFLSELDKIKTFFQKGKDSIVTDQQFKI